MHAPGAYLATANAGSRAASSRSSAKGAGSICLHRSLPVAACRHFWKQARSPSRSPQKMVQFEETKSILSTFCDVPGLQHAVVCIASTETGILCYAQGANKLIEYSLARLDEQLGLGPV